MNSSEARYCWNIAATVAVAVAVAVAGCTLPGSPQPQILTFNYRVYDIGDVEALAATLTDEVTSVRRELGPQPCNLTASFQRPRPNLQVNGIPGDVGFNLSITGANVINLAATNPAFCPRIRDLSILIGSPSSRLAIAEVAKATSGTLVFEDGTTLGANVFFRATVDGYNPSTGRANGTFAFVSNAAYGAKRVVVAEGSFAMN